MMPIWGIPKAQESGEHVGGVIGVGFFNWFFGKESCS